MAAELVTIETGIKYEKRVNGTRNSVRKFQPGKRAYPFRFSTFSGNFPAGRTDETFSIFYRTETSENLDKMESALYLLCLQKQRLLQQN